MKQTELIRLMAAPEEASAGDLAELQSLKKQFPFFQSVHLLLALAAKKHDSGLFQQTIKSTAISVPSRSRLYHLLKEAALHAEKVQRQPEVKEIPVAKEEKEEIKTVETVEEPKSEYKKEELKTVEVPKTEETKPETVNAEEKTESPVTENKETEDLKAIELAVETEAAEEQLNAQVEKEVEKQIVNAFVEKEILHTPDLHKPAAERKEAGSFNDWLKVLKSETPVPEKAAEEKPKRTFKPKDKKTEQQSIIDKVIELNPGNIRMNPGQKFFAADKAKESLLESEDLVTETLAKIYALQGNVSKAVRAYEILSLKFPQKSAYFATLIENLKKGTH